MALRAGYYGLKKKVLTQLTGLANEFTDALPIKTIGDGLNLSAEGELTCTVSGGSDYSLAEVDTGENWIDGKRIYKRVYELGTNGFSISYQTGIRDYINNLSDIDQVIESSALKMTGTAITGPHPISVCKDSGLGMIATVAAVASGSTSVSYYQTIKYIILRYTKNVTSKTTRKKSTANAETIQEV